MDHVLQESNLAVSQAHLDWLGINNQGLLWVRVKIKVRGRVKVLGLGFMVSIRLIWGLFLDSL